MIKLVLTAINDRLLAVVGPMCVVGLALVGATTDAGANQQKCFIKNGVWHCPKPQARPYAPPQQYYGGQGYGQRYGYRQGGGYEYRQRTVRVAPAPEAPPPTAKRPIPGGSPCEEGYQYFPDRNVCEQLTEPVLVEKAACKPGDIQKVPDATKLGGYRIQVCGWVKRVGEAPPPK